MTVRGRIHQGHIIPTDPLPLADGTEVEIDVRPVEPAAQQPETPTLYERYKGFIGSVEGLPSDFAAEHDHYIHGTPKRSDQ